jgi:hypothetical protein
MPPLVTKKKIAKTTQRNAALTWLDGYRQQGSKVPDAMHAHVTLLFSVLVWCANSADLLLDGWMLQQNAGFKSTHIRLSLLTSDLRRNKATTKHCTTWQQRTAEEQHV